MLEKEGIQKRLTKSFRLVAIIGAVAAALGAIMLLVTMTQYKSALVNYGFSQGDIGKAMVVFAETRSATRGIVGYDDDSMVDAMMELHDTKKEAFIEYWAVIEETIVKDSERQVYDAINEKLDAYWPVEQKAIDIGATTDQALSAQAQAMMTDEVSPQYDEIYELMKELMNANVNEGNRLEKNLQIVSFVFLIVMVVIIIGAIVISARMGAQIASGIAGPLKDLEDRLKTFAQGNLHDPFPEVKTQDEVASMIDTAKEMATTLNTVINDAGDLMGEMAKGNYDISSTCKSSYVGDFEKLLAAMRDMRNAMITTINQISEASSQVSAGASNLAESSQSMAEGATDQAGAVEELQATITNITSNIEQAADQAEVAYNEAKKYAEEAAGSSVEMKAMVDAMARIDETSNKIGNIISEIEDIASQTNLLSLNATIEAARAGEAGRGFAVVADQIRQLAEQTTKSAVDTRELIEGALSEVQDGNKAAARVSESIEHVVEGIQEIAESSKTVSDVARGQATAIEQAEQGVNQISEVVQSNSAAAQESSATSEELSAQAISLDELVGKFVLPN